MLYSITDLQGSQTKIALSSGTVELYSITDLQGSQTMARKSRLTPGLYSITDLQGSQTEHFSDFYDYESFTVLLIYKVLKPQI